MVPGIMRLGELLTAERIHIPFQVDSVAEGLLLLLPPDVTVEGKKEGGESLLGRLRVGEGGFVRRASARVVVFNLRGGERDSPWGALGLAPDPIPGMPLDDPGQETAGPSALLVLRLPRIPEFGTGAIEVLVRALRDPSVHQALLRAGSAADVLCVEELMELDLAQPLRVKHALTPLGYRVFPGTPLREVLELMARRELRSLPVVGEDLEVLGVITAAEALRQALDSAGTDSTREREEATAGDVMSRTVMCVSEDQDLLEAAQVMAKRDVSQLPVVKEGEIIGILTRDAVLKAVLASS